MGESYLMGKVGGIKINGSEEMAAKALTNMKKGDVVEIRNGYGFGGTYASNFPVGNNDQYTGFSFSPDGSYMLMTNAGSGSLVKLSGDTWLSVTVPSIASNVNEISDWHPDGSMFAIGATTGSQIYTYRLARGLVTAITPPTLDNLTNTRAVRFSGNGKFIAVGGTTTPFLNVRKVEDGGFGNQPLTGVTLSTLGQVNSVDFSNDGKFMAVAHSSAPYLTIFKIQARSDDPFYMFTFTKIANPSVLPTGTGRAVRFSNDSKKLFVGHDNTPHITLYSISGDTFTKDANPTILPSTPVYQIEMAPDDHVALTKDSSRFISGYREDPNGVYQRFLSFDLGASTADSAYNMRFSPDGSRFVAGKATSPYTQQFKGAAAGLTTNRYTSSVNQWNVLHVGIAKKDAIYNNENVGISTIPIKR